MLRDELDPALDRYSLQVLGYPHLPSEVRIEQDGELVVEFNGINLVDSATSLTGSMGFFRFRMELIEGLSPHRGAEHGGHLLRLRSADHHQHRVDHLGGLRSLATRGDGDRRGRAGSHGGRCIPVVPERELAGRCDAADPVGPRDRRSHGLCNERVRVYGDIGSIHGTLRGHP